MTTVLCVATGDPLLAFSAHSSLDRDLSWVCGSSSVDDFSSDRYSSSASNSALFHGPSLVHGSSSFSGFSLERDSSSLSSSSLGCYYSSIGGSCSVGGSSSLGSFSSVDSSLHVGGSFFTGSSSSMGTCPFMGVLGPPQVLLGAPGPQLVPLRSSLLSEIVVRYDWRASPV